MSTITLPQTPAEPIPFKTFAEDWHARRKPTLRANTVAICRTVLGTIL
jgi:hypothetical protein